MAAHQFLLFKPARPLVERLGEGFFRELPRKPGVYLMCGAGEGVLYVGKAKDLRQRLNSYRVAHPERLSRKILRLLAQVERIHWDECRDEAGALLRENQLLRVLRPRFNTMNVYPQARVFLGWSRNEHGLLLGVSREQEIHDHTYGVFKAASRRAFVSLLRLLWRALQPGAVPGGFPSGWVTGRPPGRFLFPSEMLGGSAGDLMELLDGYLGGSSAALIEWLGLRQPAAVSGFERALQQSDLECITEFYQRGPERNRELRRVFGRETITVKPEELDDLLVRQAVPAT